MNSRQRTLAAIHGRPHDRLPVAQHNFMFAIKHAGLSVKDYVYNPDKAAQALADAAYDFGYDCVIIDFDTCALAEAMGAKIVFEGEAPARIEAPAVKSVEDVKNIPIPDPACGGRLPLWVETTRLLRKKVGGELAVMGRADQGPFGLLGLLYDTQDFMMALADPEKEGDIFAALDVCARAGVAFAKAQIEAGADMTSIGDGMAGESLISPEMYRKFAQPYEKKYKEMLGAGLLSLHICGKSNNIIEGMIDTGADILELDHYNDLDRTFATINGRCCVFGNIDPSGVLCYGSRRDVMEKCRGAIMTARRHQARFVLCPGCLIMANTPPENVRAMAEAAAEYGVCE
jgi:uroporphyrinogen decarboxylase